MSMFKNEYIEKLEDLILIYEPCIFYNFLSKQKKIYLYINDFSFISNTCIY
jgi:hypothetical protein